MQLPASGKKLTVTPTFETVSKLGLLRGSGIVRVGMKQDEAFAIFAQPPNSYQKTDLPESIEAPYEANCWQSNDEGFGTILYEGKVVTATDILDKKSEERLQQNLKQYTDAFGAPQYFDEHNRPTPGFLDGKYVRYWFWQSGQDNTGDLLMICATEGKPGKLSITTAVGWEPAMEALRMTPYLASRDQPKADELIAKERNANKPNSANSSNR